MTPKVVVMMDLELFQKAMGGHRDVPDDWVSGTGLRALIQGDPALLWLRYHGAAHGFEEDDKEYSFLEWVGDKGRAFEATWIRNVAPEAVQAMNDDKDVRRVQGLTRTLALMTKRTPVIMKAALWWAPERIYGTADLIVLASWLYAKFPHLKPAREDGGPDHYVVLDCKFTTGLDKSDKATDLACNSAQVRVYSYILGHLQNHMPRSAYLVTRDRPFDPLVVAVDHRLEGPLDPRLGDLRDWHVHIKLHGHQYAPWTHELVACNFANDHDAPWHKAKKLIAAEALPLEWLPHIGRSQARELRLVGIRSLDHVLAIHPDHFHWETLKGIGNTAAARIRAVCHANRDGRATPVPSALIPPRTTAEFYVDYEYLSNVNVDFNNDFPAMAGKEMVFMVGVGWERDGRWLYRQFVAASETPEAERAMFLDFLRFLEHEGALRRTSDAVLYHWSDAEVWQSAKAAERLSLRHLGLLPWCDLQKPFHAAPIGLPGCWGFGLKAVAKAVGFVSRDHRVDWPELDSGLAASVMGWRMYERLEPLHSPEIGMLSQYLEVDCEAMWRVLSWMRAVAVDDVPYYVAPKLKPRGTRQPPSGTRQRTEGRRSRRRASGIGWYRGCVAEDEEASKALGIGHGKVYPEVLRG